MGFGSPHVNEPEYRVLVENSFEFVVLVDGMGQVRYVSPSVEHILGWTPEEHIALGPRGLVHPDDLSAGESALAMLATAEQPFTFTFRMRAKDDSYRWIESIAENMLDSPGVEAIVCHCRDITERKAAHEALAASEARFRALVENNFEFVVLLDADAKPTYVSTSVEGILGWTPEEHLAMPLMELVHPDDREEVGSLVEGLLAGEPAATTTLRARAKDGSYRWIESVSQNSLDVPGVQAIVIHNRDVTERKQDHEDQLAATATLENAQRIARLGNWTWDEGSSEITWSKEMYRIFGVVPEATPTTASFLDLIHPADRELMSDWISQASEGRGPPGIEFRIVRPDGKERVLYGDGEAVVNEAGTIAKLAGTAHDITDLKRAEREAAALAERLRLLHSLDQQVLGAASLDEIAQIAVRRAREILPCDRASLVLIEPDRGTALFVAVQQDGPRGPPARERIPLEHFVVALPHDAPWAIFDINDLATRSPVIDGLLKNELQSAIAATLRAKDEVIGALLVASTAPDAFDESQAEQLKELADEVALAAQHGRLREELATRAKELETRNAERERFLAQLVQAQEEERKRVARELHDSLGQTLTSATLFAKSLEMELPEASRGGVAELEKALTSAIKDVRQLVWTLRPPELDEIGLAASLRRLASDLADRTGLAIDISDFLGGSSLAPEIRATAYRVIQEALNNVIKHAHADTVTVELTQSDGVLSVSVLDDGRGFDTRGDAATAGNFGLESMQERAELVNGRLTVESEPGKGTTVSLEVPLPS